MWKNNMKSTATKHLGVKPRVLFISFLFISMLFAGIASASESDSEGIKVHGRWEIQVINPDGGVAQTVVFENALSDDASMTLTRLLAGQAVVDRDDSGDLLWDLLTGVSGVADTTQCDDITGDGRLGANRDDNSPTRASVVKTNDSRSLTLSRVMVVPDSCVLADTFTINDVRSGNGIAYDLGDGYTAHYSEKFTQKTLPAPIVVALGQAVSLKVTLSFE